MRKSNEKVREYLLENGYDHIWFKSHNRRKDIVWTQTGSYRATDLFNLFDGLCFLGGKIIFLQMKTNQWAKEEPIYQFLRDKYPYQVIVFNVTNKPKECKGHYKIFIRKY